MRNLVLAVALAFSFFAADGARAQTTRVSVTGELVDTFCSVSAIMFAYGSAHHQCAVWCAIGGVPVSIKDDKGDFYMVLRVEDDETSVAPPRLVTIMSHRVTVEGDLLTRDGVNYLLVNKVADDKGIVTVNHDEHGIVPFGE
jgi:hypothetical protein